MTKQTFILTIGPDVELSVLAEDSHRLWNGFAVPILTEGQAAIVGAAIGEPDLSAGESDGLQWELRRCTDCGMPHNDEHSCEPIQGYGEA